MRRNRLVLAGLGILVAGVAAVLWFYLREPALTLYKGHSGWVQSLAFSPDGKTLAGAIDGVRLWDVQTGVLRQQLEQSDTVFSIAFSPDGKRVAGGKGTRAERRFTGEEELKIWDAGTGKLERAVPGVKALALAFSADGSILATAGGDGEDAIQLWDVQTGTIKRSLAGHPGGVYAVAFATDNASLASVGNSPSGKTQEIKLWDVRTGELKRQFDGHEMRVDCLAFWPDGQTLLSAGQKNDNPANRGQIVEIKLWNVRTGQLKEPTKVAPSPDQPPSTVNPHVTNYGWGQVRGMATSGDGKTVAVGIFNLDGTLTKCGQIYLWNADGKTARDLKQWSGVWSVALPARQGSG